MWVTADATLKIWEERLWEEGQLNVKPRLSWGGGQPYWAVVKYVPWDVNIPLTEWDLPGLTCREKSVVLTTTHCDSTKGLPLWADFLVILHRFKGGLVLQICACRTHDITVGIRWCLWPHGSLNVTFYPSKKDKTNLPELLLYWLTSTFWKEKWNLSLLWSHWMYQEVLKLGFSHRVAIQGKAPMLFLKAIWLSHEWEQLAKNQSACLSSSIQALHPSETSELISVKVHNYWRKPWNNTDYTV